MLNEPFKIGIYWGVYYHPQKDKLQYSCRIADPKNGEQIEEFFATEREAAISWNIKAPILARDSKDKTGGIRLNEIDN